MPLSLEERISSSAVEAMLQEVAVTPKPGLVDRSNSGAHNDMDFYTFINSASLLQPYFYKMALEGSSFEGEDFKELLKRIRPIGIEAEKSMFCRTRGVNTHKGLIFSLGILSSAASYLLKKNNTIMAEQICKTASEMCCGIVENELVSSNKNDTIGEKLYKLNKIKGIRGEAESGFFSVITTSLPYLRKSEGNWNNRLLNTLLHLMTEVEDSNIVGRHNKKTLMEVKSAALAVLKTGGASDTRGMEILKQMDLNFIEKNISPGGCADLLAVTIFLYRIEKNE